MSALSPFRAVIDSAWIDYNGHLRDAYYGVIMSLAIDDFMDQVGLDAAYRGRTQCTLYTLESHMHYLHEVKAADDLRVASEVLDSDAKRIHLGCRFMRAAETVATGDAMLLHVSQAAAPASAPLPPDVTQRLGALRLPAPQAAEWGPVSRKIELKRRLVT